MPMDRSLYPDDWEAIALRVKTAANWTCQQCGKPCRRPGESEGELVERIELDRSHWALELWEAIVLSKLTRFTLTTAHPNHDPENPSAELRAWCAPCHGRYDLKAIHTKRMLKRERLGQLTLLLGGDDG